MPRAVKFPLSQTCQMGSRSLLTIRYNMTDTDAQVSRWEKEQECDNADKPLMRLQTPSRSLLLVVTSLAMTTLYTRVMQVMGVMNYVSICF